MRILIVCLAAALAVATTPAPARAAEAPQAAPAQPSARQLELTRRYIELSMTDQVEDSLRQMVVAMASADPTTSGLPPEDREFLIDLTADLTADMLPQMIDRMVPVYAATFTETELEALIEFFSTEMGRGILAKTVEVMPAATEAAMGVMPQIFDKMAARICQHYGCTADELQQLKREMRGEAPVARPAK
jgi:Uncharacterized protein conserved in bacteria (DUF2059).